MPSDSEAEILPDPGVDWPNGFNCVRQRPPVYVYPYAINVRCFSVKSGNREFGKEIMRWREHLWPKAPRVQQDIETSEGGNQLIPDEVSKLRCSEEWGELATDLGNYPPGGVGDVCSNPSITLDLINIGQFDDPGVRHRIPFLNKKNFLASLFRNGEFSWRRVVAALGHLPICTYDDAVGRDKRDNSSPIAIGNTTKSEPCYPLFRFSGSPQIFV